MRSQTFKVFNLVFLLSSFFLVEKAYAVLEPTIELNGTELAITEATICVGQTVSLIIPENGIPEAYSWFKGCEVIGIGFTLIIENFSEEKSGNYVLVQNLFDGSILETNFNLHFLTLGENIDACEAQSVDFLLANGPRYTWSNGAINNKFKVTFQETATISVSAITEFGYIATAKKVITITDGVAIALGPIKLCQGAEVDSVTPTEFNNDMCSTREIMSKIYYTINPV